MHFLGGGFGWQKCNKSKPYNNTEVLHHDFSKWVPSSYRVCNCKRCAKCSLSLPCTSLWFLSERASPFHAAFVTRCVTSFFDRGTPRQQQWQLQTWQLCHSSSSLHHWIALVCQRFFKFALECISKVRRLFYLDCARLFSVLIRSMHYFLFQGLFMKFLGVKCAFLLGILWKSLALRCFQLAVKTSTTIRSLSCP